MQKTVKKIKVLKWTYFKIYLKIKTLIENIKKIFDVKQLIQDVGNELVKKTYLKSNTQVRFDLTIIFLFFRK
jgi:hypothetical protein